MAISEAARSDLYIGLRDVLGPDRAETLMSAIPLYDLDEVATKGDLALLRAELGAKIAQLRAELKSDLAQLQRTIVGWMVSLFVATVGAVIGVALLS